MHTLRWVLSAITIVGIAGCGGTGELRPVGHVGGAVDGAAARQAATSTPRTCNG